ncbi:MAG: hypothetical protein IJW92_08980 [Clostridia bacterium]|nr:hypothetical protein [Clostridia bacterium]
MKAERKIIVAISAIVLIGLAVTVIVQAASIYTIKNDQELKFQSHISSAVYSLEEYKETGYGFKYQDALMELHSAASIANLLQDRDEYEGMQGVLLSIVGTYYSFPEDLALFTDELIEVLNAFIVHHNVENLYTKLIGINNRLTAMLFERLEPPVA